MKRASLNALRVLATVAETRSFKGAADKLGVTQSAVSRQIQTLEEQLGLRLVQRDNRMHALTDAGSLLAPELQRIFSQLDELINTLTQSKAADIRTLRLAVHENCLQWFLAPWLDDFHSLYPHLKLQIQQADEYLSEASAEYWRNALERNEVDVVLSCGQMRGKGVVMTPVQEFHWQLHGDAKGPLFSVIGSDDLSNLTQQQRNAGTTLTYRGVQEVANTGMALTLAQLQHGQLLMPSHYSQPRQGQRLAVDLPAQELTVDAPGMLQTFHARHKENELAVVAFTNWLRHVVTV